MRQAHDFCFLGLSGIGINRTVLAEVFWDYHRSITENYNNSIKNKGMLIFGPHMSDSNTVCDHPRRRHHTLTHNWGQGQGAKFALGPGAVVDTKAVSCLAGSRNLSWEVEEDNCLYG